MNNTPVQAPWAPNTNAVVPYTPQQIQQNQLNGQLAQPQFQQPYQQPYQQLYQPQYQQQYQPQYAPMQRKRTRRGGRGGQMDNRYTMEMAVKKGEDNEVLAELKALKEKVKSMENKETIVVEPPKTVAPVPDDTIKLMSEVLKRMKSMDKKIDNLTEPEPEPPKAWYQRWFGRSDRV